MKLLPPNYGKIRKELMGIMDAPEWDDGSYAPILIRLAWHSSATYDKATNTGGSRGATMRFVTEASDPDNAGLHLARSILEPVKQRHPEISHADLWVLAAYAALEKTGGPVLKFRGGRKDEVDPAKAPPNGRLPNPSTGLEPGVDADGRPNGWRKLATHMRDVFYRMGFADREIVALLCGGHVYGRCHPTRSGFAGPWVEEPWHFSNEYAADMVGDEWLLVSHEDAWLDEVGAAELRPAPGLRQYVNKKPPRKMSAPNASKYPPGRYTVVGPKYINRRAEPDPKSPITGQPAEGTVLDVVAVKVFGTAVRGLLDCGGWVSILGTKGVTFLERSGDLSLAPGTFKVGRGPVPWADTPADAAKGKAAAGVPLVPKGERIAVTELKTVSGSIVGKAAGGWLLLYDAHKTAVPVERVVEGVNDDEEAEFEDAGEPNQMMLPSDMVLLWDEDFRPHLEQFAEDEELLREEFGAAYKKLTELGCF